MARTLTEFEVLTFDCYGTLIDWESGLWDALQPLLMANGTDAVTRELALAAISELESAQQAETPRMLYSQILENVHRGLAKRFDLKTTIELDRAYGASLPHWPAFPDSADALRRLKRRFRLVILSNVHREGFAASNRKLGVEFDAVYTAEDVGSYKPDPRSFEYMLDRLNRDLGVAGADVLHTAQSLFHDHVQARAFGLANAWIDRQRLAEGGGWGATAEVA
ncbi:MAG TPA: haloacid dehalogenase type II, partial [Paracoccaceae bacterium]|nr:haloacid dehalogenase type II [Paracoccaceae bacterium]